MISPQHQTVRRLLILCAIIPAALLAVVGWFMHGSEEELASSSQWVSHTVKVLDEVQWLDLALGDAESSERGFLLTTNEAYLDPYRAARKTIPRHQAALKELTRDNPKQQAALSRLKPLIDERLLQLSNSIALAENGDIPKAVASVQAARDKASSDAIDHELTSMETEEQRLLADRDAAAADRFKTHSFFTASLLAVSILFVGGILFLLYRLAKSQAILTVCAWSKTIEYEGEWLTFEQYLSRRFGVQISHGISPTAAEKFRADMDTMADESHDQPK